MSAEAQTWIALAVVALAAALLVRSAWRKRKTPGCGGGGCPTDPFKSGLKRRKG